jgi:hypothetical protein
MLSRTLRNIALIIFILIFGLWAKFHFTTARVKNDPTSEANLDAAKIDAQTLLAALEKYRGDTGLYPATLDQLNATYLSSPVNGFRYSARLNDWVYKSDECVAREKSLHGWIMKPTADYKKEVADFRRDCLTGYRYYQLQSRDFPHDPQTLNIDRWAYYDSSNRQWSLGWCSHDGSRHGRGEGTADNGVCRSQQRNDPW